MAGRVIAVDITWAREQPGHRGEEDNAAAFQVSVAYGDCAGSSRSPGVCCRKCRSYRLTRPRPLLPAPPCSHDSLSQTSLEANAVSAQIRKRGKGQREGAGGGGQSVSAKKKALQWINIQWMLLFSDAHSQRTMLG